MQIVAKKHSSLKIEPTQRGFAYAEFTDRYGVKCSIQDSSLATESAIWLGVHFAGVGYRDVSSRMHLTQDMVAELLPLLKRFVRTGSIA